MIEEKGSIKKSTAQAICDAVKVKEGTTEGVPFNEVAKRVLALPTASGENPLIPLIEGTTTELTPEMFKGATKIGVRAFSSNPNITSVTIDGTVTTIENYAFNSLSKLERVTIGNSVLSIGEYAFYYAPKLKYLTLGNNLISIDDNAFSRCFELESLVMPDSVTTVDNYAFYKCSKLTDVKLSKNLTSIDHYVFDETNIANITIPNSVTHIYGGFRDCLNLGVVRIGNGVVAEGNTLFGSIGQGVFLNCTNLTDIYIDAPEGSVKYSPWGATNAQIHWNTPLPSEEV